MQNKKLFYSLLIIIAVILASQACFASDNKDFQYWTTADFYIDLNKNWEISFEEQFRLKNDAGNLLYQHYDLGLVRKNFSEGMDLGFNFKKVYEKDSNGKWRAENRPHLNLTLKGKMFNLGISNRSRLEYRNREKKKDEWRYRNKFKIDFPVELTELKLKPYIATEPFININEKGYYQNRLSGGFSLKLSKNIKGNIYYMLQTVRSSGERYSNNIIGTALKFYF